MKFRSGEIALNRDAEGATTPETLRPKGPHRGQALWKADGFDRPTEGVSRNFLNGLRSKLSGSVTEGVAEMTGPTPGAFCRH